MDNSVCPIDFRYGRKEIKEVFGEKSKLQYLLDVEASLARAHAEVGNIPKKIADEISKKASIKFVKVERVTWVQSTWGFMKQIFPLLGAGILVAGFVLGRPGHSALIPEHYIQSLVGGNTIWSNLFASVSGALMYFATLTEVPILQGLLGAGMGKGPSLSLLLAGPALSLPNMLVIGGVMGVKKTAAFCVIIVILSTVAGMTYGWITG